jgi:hypothetical protein
MVGVGAMAFAAAVPLARVLLLPAGAVSGALTHEDFAGVVGTTFRAGLRTGASANLRLLAVHPLTAPTHAAQPPPTGDGFVLEFEAAARTELVSGTYAVQHSSLGRFDLFVTPVGPRGSAPRYESVFNRLWS